MFDDDETLLAEVEHPAYGAIRVPDGRTLAWSEYGSARGVPCILVPDAGSSRLAPAWLLHDSALPSAVRLLALDRPGTGASDPIGVGGRADPAADLRRLVDTLAVGRVAVVGIGQGVDDVFAFAARYPRLVASVTGVSARLSEPVHGRRSLLHPFVERASTAGGLLGRWLTAAGHDADLTAESTWARALPRMAPEVRSALGDRWREADFRAALAADTTLTPPARGTARQPATPAEWIHHAGADPVRAHLWHGQQEGGTTVSEIRSAIGHRPGWQVTGIAGPTAVLGIWPQILTTAGNSFNTASAA